MPETIYIYDGSFDGLLTCVFDSFKKRETPFDVRVEDAFEQRLDAEYYFVETDAQKAARVNNGIMKNGLMEIIYYAFLSRNPDRHKYIFDYIVLSFKMGKRVNEYLINKSVAEVLKMRKNVWHESHQLMGFVRFEELSTGVLYSKITPKNNVLEIVVNHFIDRLNTESFVIHDLTRNMAAFYKDGDYFLTELDKDVKVRLSENEENYRELWKLFYETVAIKERRNEKLRISNMPKRFWRNMVEMPNE